MVTMIATKPHTYAHKTLKADEEFEVEAGHVPTLISLGRARLKDDKPKGTAVEPVKTTSTEEKAAEPSGKYATRRMKADDENPTK